MNWEGRIFRKLMVPTIVLGMALAGVLAFEVWVRISNLASAQKDNHAWSYSQLEVEYHRLDRAIDQTREAGLPGLDELRRRFDVFFSRVALIDQIGELPASTNKINRLKMVMDDQVPLFDGPDNILLANLDEVQESLRGVGQLPRLVAIDQITETAKQAVAERQSIVTLLELLVLVVISVTLVLTRTVSRLRRQARTVEQTKRAAETSRLRLETTLRASLDAVVVIDETGNITDYNGSAQTIFGYSRDEVLGQSFLLTFLPAEHRAAQEEALARFRETGETTFAENGRHEFLMVDRKGRIFPAEISISLARTMDGPRFVTYIRDITEKKEKDQQLIEAHDAALDAFREKSRFFAMMSHEMRTPLNGVLSALQLLEDSPLDAEQRKYVTAAARSGDILLEHINDVLAIERVETGATELNLQPCDLTGLTSGLVGMMEPLARTNDVHLHLDQSGLDNRLVMTDPRAIQQVLVNLINNAIKFSPGGEVTLSAEKFHDEAAGARIRFEVTDTGQGIAEHEIAKIFEDFVSLDSRYERRTGGTGLGLGIVRRLVRQLGGEIHCTSTVGEGTRFSFDIEDIPAEDEQSDVAPQTATMAPKAAPLRALVVDDNETNRDLLVAMLERLGHSARTAVGGEDAIAIAAREAFDVILMDISMPGVNGVQATQAIRAGDGPNTRRPIIAFTAHAMPHEIKDFNDAGMAGILRKPVNMKDLKKRLAGVAANTDRVVPETLLPKGTPANCLDEDQIAQLLDVLGRERLTERIATLIDKMNDEIPSLSSARDREELQSRTHEIAGMCGMFGASKLYEALQEIEAACKGGKTEAAKGMLTDIPPIWEQTQQAWRQKILQ